MPRGAKTLLSAGCAGRWYFDWVAENYGTLRKHIGVEFYAPKPDDLPPDVEWISNTVGDMSGVASGCADLVFSGQNIEHLWPEDILNFLLEAHRVLRQGGALVVDSPNRLVTSAQRWCHPEHIVEFTPDEIRDLLELAGFKVKSIWGLWLCRDPRTGSPLAYNRMTGVPGWRKSARVAAAVRDPDNSFVWWATAQKARRQPDTAALRKRVQEISAQAWIDRARRVLSVLSPEGLDGNPNVVGAPAGQSGVLIYGPYIPLRPGAYAATFAIKAETSGHASDDVIARCDVMVEDKIIADRPISAGEIAPDRATLIEVKFSLDQVRFGTQFRLISTGRATVRAAFSVGFQENGQTLVPAPSLPS